MNEMSSMSRGDSGKRNPNSAGDPNSRISRKLREFYDGIREERIPDRFLDLLEKLDQAEQEAKSQTKSAGKN